MSGRPRARAEEVYSGIRKRAARNARNEKGRRADRLVGSFSSSVPAEEPHRDDAAPGRKARNEDRAEDSGSSLAWNAADTTPALFIKMLLSVSEEERVIHP